MDAQASQDATANKVKLRISTGIPPNLEIFEIEVEPIYTYYDIVDKLCQYKKYHYSGFYYPGKGELCGKNLDEPVVDTQIELKEIGIFTPKNSFRMAKNIQALYRAGLQDTINLYDVCLINQAKIGEWIGFGRGPITVDKHDDNRVQNLIFVIYGNTKPYVYNIYCLNKLIDIDSDTIMIPHLNKKIGLEKVEQPQYVHGLKVLRIRLS